MSHTSAYNNFRQEFERLLEKDKIFEQEFLQMAKRAVDAYAQEPEAREKIAYNITGLWFVIEDKMGKQYVEQYPAIAEIGGRFADLELPDAHISLEGAESIDGMWINLADEIERLIKD